MATEHKPTPVERSKILATELLTAWGMPTTEVNIKKWSKQIRILGRHYKTILRNTEIHDVRNTNQIKLPHQKDRIFLLNEIYEASQNLVSILEIAKTIHPDFLDMYVIPSDFDPSSYFSEKILNNLKVCKFTYFHNNPLIKSIDMMSIKSYFSAVAIEESGSAPRWNSFKYGHPTLQLIKSCIINLASLSAIDPDKKAHLLASTIHKFIGSETAKDYEDGPPGWQDYLSQAKTWWQREGKKEWTPILSLSNPEKADDSASAQLDDYLLRLSKFKQEMIRRDVENDLGELGGPSPDPRKLRALKQGKRREPHKRSNVKGQPGQSDQDASIDVKYK